MDSAGQADAPLNVSDSLHSGDAAKADVAGIGSNSQGHVAPQDTPAQFVPLEKTQNYVVTTPPNPSGHTCGTGCGHDHSNSHHQSLTHTSSSAGGYYYIETTPVRHKEPELPKNKSKAGWWALGIVAAAGVGAYLINNDKAKKKNDTPKPADWKERAEKSTVTEPRGL